MNFLNTQFKTYNRLKYKNLLLILILIILFIFSFPVIKIKINRFYTLSSLKNVNGSGVYLMTYKLDYKLNSYLKIGSKDINELYGFIDRNTGRPFRIENAHLVFNNDVYDRDSFAEYDECSAFSALNFNHTPIIGRNLDIRGNHPVLALYTSPDKGYRSISIVEMPILGYISDNEVLKTYLSRYNNRGPLLRSPYMPRDGMNEKGLVVATLNVPNEPVFYDSLKPVIGRWQTLRTILDKASTVEEAVLLLSRYNSFDGSVHYFIADASGNSAVVEYLNGSIHTVYKKEPFQIVTNFYLSDKNSNGKGHLRYETAYKFLNSKSGVINNNEAMDLLSTIKEPSTAYSVVYNPSKGKAIICHNKNYIDSYTFNLKMSR